MRRSSQVLQVLTSLLLNGLGPTWRRQFFTRPNTLRFLQLKAANDGWTSREDSELLSEVPEFSVGDGLNIVTFWSALAMSNPMLSAISPEECKKRMAVLSSRNQTSLQIDFGPEPTMLTNWRKLDNFRYVGLVDGRNVWLTVEMEGRLQSDPRLGSGYVVALGGRVFELGLPDEDQQMALTEFTSEEPFNVSTLVVDQLNGMTRRNALLPIMFVSGFSLGFTRNGVDQRPALVESNQKPKAATSLKLSQPPQGTLRTGSLPFRVPFTLSELEARQKLQVETDRWLLWLTETNDKEFLEKDLQVYRGLFQNVPLFSKRESSRQALLELYNLDKARLSELKEKIKTSGEYQVNDKMKFESAKWIRASTSTSAFTTLLDSKGRLLENKNGPLQWAPRDRYFTRDSSTLFQQLSKEEERIASTIQSLDAFDRNKPACHSKRAWLLIELKRAKQNLNELSRVEAQFGGKVPAVEMGVWEEN